MFIQEPDETLISTLALDQPRNVTYYIKCPRSHSFASMNPVAGLKTVKGLFIAALHQGSLPPPGSQIPPDLRVPTCFPDTTTATSQAPTRQAITSRALPTSSQSFLNTQPTRTCSRGICTPPDDFHMVKKYGQNVLVTRDLALENYLDRSWGTRLPLEPPVDPAEPYVHPVYARVVIRLRPRQSPKPESELQAEIFHITKWIVCTVTFPIIDDHGEQIL
ncbi:hypothetical protein HD554DRAFT_2172924 [Boletus coccyginus]|nr:hypothetical protein HD554DRAFT_2172924 [Boletus coccyginus]